jgi:hypothetical protein
MKRNSCLCILLYLSIQVGQAQTFTGKPNNSFHSNQPASPKPDHTGKKKGGLFKNMLGLLMRDVDNYFYTGQKAGSGGCVRAANKNR